MDVGPVCQDGPRGSIEIRWTCKGPLGRSVRGRARLMSEASRLAAVQLARGPLLSVPAGARNSLEVTNLPIARTRPRAYNRNTIGAHFAPA